MTAISRANNTSRMGDSQNANPIRYQVITPEHVEKLTAITKLLESHLSQEEVSKSEAS
jgi:hypothetical protein